ncbi:hypothetical protein HPB49_010463 [Dermacentor silvarum]|uniref:Uncharacterized protein n=1 Tax=Dermacentor silvarum TaxID=543639 RepID=A0ACB8D4S4_DERSI|nr:hypothetical protein HPB49_010463 [Dermacentor silvarum]
MHGPIDAQVTKATIALGSIFKDTCTSNAQCKPRGASCSEGRYLYKLSEPLCDYSEQCVFAQLNGVYTDHLIGDCALEFVRSLDGKTCDKLQTTAGNVLDSPARPTANATLPEPLASRTSVSMLLQSSGDPVELDPASWKHSRLISHKVGAEENSLMLILHPIV